MLGLLGFNHSDCIPLEIREQHPRLFHTRRNLRRLRPTGSKTLIEHGYFVGKIELEVIILIQAFIHRDFLMRNGGLISFRSVCHNFTFFVYLILRFMKFNVSANTGGLCGCRSVAV
ncbi:MAG: hypothetical protein EZS28_010784 [Streblomastix strix]|uniref:Uncharacterized protein n=1 Tax=Streblomastix strix TaxID=222440 RepID=A0A5J4WFN0_9EUKA|nr:MAG: hypothetical protein EZS28_010784 [Streblomastix strix]